MAKAIPTPRLPVLATGTTIILPLPLPSTRRPYSKEKHNKWTIFLKPQENPLPPLV